MTEERRPGRHRSQRPIFVTLIVTVSGILVVAILTEVGAKVLNWAMQIGAKPFDVALQSSKRPLIKGDQDLSEEFRNGYCEGDPEDPPGSLPSGAVVTVTLTGRSEDGVVLKEVRPHILKEEELGSEYHAFNEECGGDYFDPPEVTFDFARPKRIEYTKVNVPGDPNSVEDVAELSLSLEKGEGSGFWLMTGYSKRRNVAFTWDLIVTYASKGKIYEENLNELSGVGHFISRFACGSLIRSREGSQDEDPFSNPYYSHCRTADSDRN